MITKEKLIKYGADVASGLTRCMQNEELYFRLIGMMANDTAVAALGEALKDGDLDRAFDLAHRLKGTAANLSLTPVFAPASELTELLRNKTPGDYDKIYENIVRKIAELKELSDQA